MSNRRVTITLTLRQASLLWTLADMAGDDEDLLNMEWSSTDVAVGRRAMTSLARAIDAVERPSALTT